MTCVVFGPREKYGSFARSASLGPSTSPSVTGGRVSPGYVKRSPEKRVRVVASKRTPLSQPCGTWGTSIQVRWLIVFSHNGTTGSVSQRTIVRVRRLRCGSETPTRSAELHTKGAFSRGGVT